MAHLCITTQFMTDAQTHVTRSKNGPRPWTKYQHEFMVFLSDSATLELAKTGNIVLIYALIRKGRTNGAFRYINPVHNRRTNPRNLVKKWTQTMNQVSKCIAMVSLSDSAPLEWAKTGIITLIYALIWKSCPNGNPVFLRVNLEQAFLPTRFFWMCTYQVRFHG